MKYFHLTSLVSALIFFSSSLSSQTWDEQNFSQPDLNETVPVYDSPVSVVTMSGKEVNCSPIVDSTYFKCDDKSFFQPSSPYAKLVRLNEKNEIETDTVESIANENGEILFVRRDIGDFTDRTLIAKYNTLLNFKFSLQLESIEDQEFNNIKQMVNQQEREILQLFKNQPYKVALDDGTSLVCSQAYPDKPTEVASETLTYYRGVESCGVFDCNETGGTSANPQEKTRLYFHASPSPMSHPSVMRIKNGNVVEFKKFKNIKASNGDILEESFQMPSLVGHSNSQTQPSRPISPYHVQDQDIFKVDIFPEIENEDGRLSHPYFLKNIMPLEAACEGHDALIENLQKNVDERTAKHELAQVFMFIENEMLSMYIDPAKARENFCHDQGKFYSPEAYEKREYNFAHKGISKILSPEELKSLFHFAQSMDDIAFGYKTDGCYARAHLMARRFEEKGYSVEKAWINGDLRIAGENPVRWNYHVAPSVYAYDEQGNVQRMIIDPSVSDKPLSAEEWSGMMTQHIGKNVHETGFPFPSNSSPFKRASLAFTNSDPFYPVKNTTMTEEDKMNTAYQTMADYLPLQDLSNNF